MSSVISVENSLGFGIRIQILCVRCVVVVKLSWFGKRRIFGTLFVCPVTVESGGVEYHKVAGIGKGRSKLRPYLSRPSTADYWLLFLFQRQRQEIN